MKKDISKDIMAGIEAARETAEEYVADHYDELCGLTLDGKACSIADAINENCDFRRISMHIASEYANALPTVPVEWEEDPETMTQKCCLCGKEFEGLGNNPYPFAGERCCDDCNDYLVIPARREISRVMNGTGYALSMPKKLLHKVIEADSGKVNYLRKLREAYKSGDVEYINVD